MLALFSLGSGTAALANEALLKLPFEALLDIEIGSASRKLEQVHTVAAAVFVISRDDIARSGARSLPEALRLAPGVEVARIANNRWAVSIRGFNGRFANKLLVLKDGRSVYSPLFSGVMWEAEDAVLEDIERIEVIRGPSAAMWGSNAVNGVINIISRPARATLGTKVTASTATDEPAALTVRHGFKLGGGDVRLSFKGFDLSPATSANGTPGNDGWQSGRVGLRGEWAGDGGSHWTLVGEAHRTRADDRLDYTRYGSVPALLDIGQTYTGSHWMLRHEQPTDDGGQIEGSLSAEASRVDLQSLLREERHTLAADIQRRKPLGRHELLWGASYRYSHDRLDLPNPLVLGSGSFDRQHRDWRNVSFFIHGGYELAPALWRLSGGLRLDHDSWSGLQGQPDVRLAWTPTADTTAWGSLARATRTPSRLELDVPFTVSKSPASPAGGSAISTVRLPPPPGTLKAERVTALEFGIRQRVGPQMSFDLSAFVSGYADLVSLVTLGPQVVSPKDVNLLLTNQNKARARTHGFEAAMQWWASPTWRVQAHYSRLDLSSPRLSDPAAAMEQDLRAGRVPRHRASLRSSWTLQGGDQVDLWLRHTSRLSNPAVPAFTALDLRYAWRAGPHFELALLGQNLLGGRHAEFVSDNLPVVQSEFGRSVMLKGTWRF